MTISASWRGWLDDPKRRILPILTVAWGNEGPDCDRLHLATVPNVLRAAPDLDVHPVTSSTDTRQRPFWPWSSWPTVTRKWSPVDGRAEVAVTVVDLLPDAEVPEALRDNYEQPVGTGRIDLWTDGATLANVIPLAAGKVEIVRQTRRDLGVRLRLVDGDVDRNVRLSAGTLDFDDFPNAPDTVLGRANRVTVIGAFPNLVPCSRIDDVGARFYVCDNALAGRPTEVRVGSEVYTDGFQTVTEVGAGTGIVYTELRLASPLAELGFLDRRVAVSGGVGIVPDSVLADLLRLGGYGISRAGENTLRRVARVLSPSLSAYISANADLLDVATRRLAPQTGTVLAWSRGKVDALELLAPTQRLNLSPGTGLLYRLDADVSSTSADNVFNAVEVTFARSARDDRRLGRVRIDKSSGGDLAALLALSEQRYGRRFTVLDAADLADEADVLRLARTFLRVHALAHQRYAYAADWRTGVGELALNTRVTLTDPDEQLTAVDTRVVEWSLPPTGPQVVLETTDLEIDAGLAA